MFVDFVDKFRIILRHFFYRFGVILKVLFQGKDHWQIIFFILCSCWKINTIIFLVIKFKRPSTKFFYFMFLLEDYWNMINDQILMTTIQICENFIFKLINGSFFHSYFHSFMYRVYIEGNHHSKNGKEWYKERMI